MYNVYYGDIEGVRLTSPTHLAYLAGKASFIYSIHGDAIYLIHQSLAGVEQCYLEQSELHLANLVPLVHYNCDVVSAVLEATK